MQPRIRPTHGSHSTRHRSSTLPPKPNVPITQPLRPPPPRLTARIKNTNSRTPSSAHTPRQLHRAREPTTTCSAAQIPASALLPNPPVSLARRPRRLTPIREPHLRLPRPSGEPTLSHNAHPPRRLHHRKRSPHPPAQRTDPGFLYGRSPPAGRYFFFSLRLLH